MECDTLAYAAHNERPGHTSQRLTRQYVRHRLTIKCHDADTEEKAGLHISAAVGEHVRLQGCDADVECR